ncbi:putative membrane protein YphA (DoxX/SURF4 family) [Geobacillus thermodenitrificans]|jgi:putative oxidoreductase|uniref:DoxX family protein n=1 Tax=Geobacillus thermodenitrificans TaxID=33940 RepID=UPI002DFE3F87|nr:putative membrane protein YphA (DoxX/SURF4 family) [Geobacillus thermodenitrificans]
MAQKYKWALLILRVALGLTFFIHGVAKFQMGLGNVAGWFESIGVAGFLGYVVAFIELTGGVALIVGLGTRVISALLAFVMSGATFTVKLPAGFVGNSQTVGYELDVVLLSVAIALCLNGSQLFALDSKWFGSSKN